MVKLNPISNPTQFCWIKICAISKGVVISESEGNLYCVRNAKRGTHFCHNDVIVTCYYLFLFGASFPIILISSGVGSVSLSNLPLTNPLGASIHIELPS